MGGCDTLLQCVQNMNLQEQAPATASLLGLEQDLVSAAVCAVIRC